ncbi:regulatory protein RecX [Nocardioides sp. L-11A]|uniref:regulatory protein RecX n=1 Tax=Nocardioides sp. L-11A TaxID=3043848 RepID=UPI002499F054|nr:regulatory protein RecX [Nocardioides sp. L-11A]
MRDEEPPDDDGWTEDADPESVARKILLDQLSIKARSRRELEDRLARRRVPPEVAARLLDRFEEVGLVDDEAFARAWVEGRQRSRGLARTALAVELRRKGVADETAKAVLAEVDPGEEEAAARGLVRKKLRSMRGLDEQVAARRLVGMLARKGYSPGLAYAVVRSELGAEAQCTMGE